MGLLPINMVYHPYKIDVPFYFMDIIKTSINNEFGGINTNYGLKCGFLEALNTNSNNLI
jgi:hypothetical protein